MKNYSESMLESMSNGVITLDENHTIVTCNAAGSAIFAPTRRRCCRRRFGTLHR